MMIYHSTISVKLCTQLIGGGFPHNLVGKTHWWATEVLVCCKLRQKVIFIQYAKGES